MLDDKKFLPLKNMQAFTEQMFNNILAFQEKTHPAWDQDKQFVERIRELPLHYLVFSNGDRDSNRFDSTVAHFYPLRWEMNKIAHYIRQIELKNDIVDLHAGNGFIGSLLAREGFQIIGIRDKKFKPNQIENFYDKECYSFWEGEFSHYPDPIDVAFSAWMPSGSNFTPDIINTNVKIIIFIYTQHEINGTRQTGCNEAYENIEGYRRVAEWSNIRPENLFHDIWPDLTPSPAEERLVAIYFRNDIEEPQPYDDSHKVLPYYWEQDLYMALLAHEGKQVLRQKGYRID